MKRIPLVVAFGLAALCGGGCSHIPFIGKKKAAPGEPKQDKHIALSVEKEFFARWVDQRMATLVSQGEAEDQARAQAEQEFKQKFPATTIAQNLP